MYDVNAEKKPVSADLTARSITCEGSCRGIAGIGKRERSGDEKGFVREFTKRFNQMRMICAIYQWRSSWQPWGTYVFPAVPEKSLIVGYDPE
jgi:hypothetical protein